MAAGRVRIFPFLAFEASPCISGSLCGLCDLGGETIRLKEVFGTRSDQKPPHRRIAPLPPNNPHEWQRLVRLSIRGRSFRVVLAQPPAHH
jgi:hypothetical protein